MAVKHVVIYQCDGCGAQVASNAKLSQVTVNTTKYDVCAACLHSVNSVVNPPGEEPVDWDAEEFMRNE